MVKWRCLPACRLLIWWCSQEFKWDEARPLYLKAMRKGPDNPLVIRCYALFLLGSCDEPRQDNYNKAMSLLSQAKPKDMNNET